MIKKHKKNFLTESDIETVKGRASDKLISIGKTNDIIGAQVFHILSCYSNVIFFPLGEDAPWGFTNIKNVNDESRDKVFVVINSSISVSRQIFAAAHELYHVWYEHTEDCVTELDVDYLGDGKIEQMASRFAAEFLVNENLLKNEVAKYVKNTFKITMPDILKLSELFSVPYKTMVRRLFEIGLLNKKDQSLYLDKEDKEIDIGMKRYSIRETKGDSRIVLADLTAYAVEAYEQELISYERLEYLLNKSKLTPENVGISKKPNLQIPSDDEFDKIMEE